MCGIFGWHLPMLAPARRGILAATLARLNDERGGHSWGMAAPTGMGAPITDRGLGHVEREAYRLADYTVVYGHTRFATHGERTTDNAHPFTIGSITGAHNGVLSNHGDLNTRYKRTYAVDSQHLFAHLNEGRRFHDVVGYGAIEWIDARQPDRIFLSRMRDGDLSVVGVGTGVDDVAGVIWSSDGEHLREAIDTAGLRTFEYEIKAGAVYHARDGHLYVERMRCDLAKRSGSKWDWRRGSAGSIASTTAQPTATHSPSPWSLWDDDNRWVGYRDSGDDNRDVPDPRTFVDPSKL